MLDAAASLKLQAFGIGERVERFGYVFLEPTRAQAHMEEVWLHGLECWTLDLGDERLDEGFFPTRIVPGWVERLSRSP
jgi:hypothetical protein